MSEEERRRGGKGRKALRAFGFVSRRYLSRCINSWGAVKCSNRSYLSNPDELCADSKCDTRIEVRALEKQRKHICTKAKQRKKRNKNKIDRKSGWTEPQYFGNVYDASVLSKNFLSQIQLGRYKDSHRKY